MKNPGYRESIKKPLFENSRTGAASTLSGVSIQRTTGEAKPRQLTDCIILKGSQVATWSSHESFHRLHTCEQVEATFVPDGMVERTFLLFTGQA
ncbi:hypothetical protein Mal48_38140 [Thalassoglobus polymorphus]|uniref:Uncharacterized protein n=1 Tax=Thalassoglobus polymorphus TaxID=2527994 RepID=A0A517QSF6_9PLAN|nr:hypothetical protein Mal48_38140 [Thalassoglobus polymorphus]